MAKKNKPFAGQKMVVTGSSSGIGRAGAKQLAAKGAHVMLVARRADDLASLQREIQQAGGQASVYPCDLTDLEAVDRLGDQLLADHGKIDVLFNNAGRSIRRRISKSYERFHDFERCMQINYFGPVRLSLKLLPAMEAAGRGQIVNTSTWATMLPSPRFAAYVASKAALDGFANAVDTELRSKGVAVTQLHFPIVYTDMIGPTKLYSKLPGMTPESAGSWMVRAVEERPVRIAHGFTRIGALNHLNFPKISRRLTMMTGI